MNAHVGIITLGVRDIERAKRFYRDGLGWTVQLDYPQWVTFAPAGSSSTVALFGWDALANDAGTDPDGTGFRGITLSYIVRSEDRVAAVLAEAQQAGGSIIRPAARTQWGGSMGYFSDPDGHLWKVASGSGEQPYAE